MLHDVVARHEVDQLAAQHAGEGVGQFQFLVGLTLVADQATQTHTTRVGVLQNALGDVVGRVHGHHLARHHDVDFLRLVFADGHGEAAAHHVTQHVVGHIVHAVVGAVFFQEVDRGDHAAASAADAWLRAAGLDAADVLVADLHHVFELQVLHRTGFSGQREDGVLRLCVQDQAGRVGLGVAADDQDFLAEVGQSSQSVLGSCRFTDAAFTVKGDLPKFGHCSTPFRKVKEPKQALPRLWVSLPCLLVLLL
ncbi:hypothetical protein Y695_03230 [Hydrogenophaga sp. T4]|nr:hypothetical protein Y695_03230 [Hydrogenophaga sp. T4]